MGSYRYAAYGSNLHPLRIQERVPSARLLGTSELPGYDLRFDKIGKTDGSGKCSLVTGNGGVHLAIFEVLEEERSLLDKAEGLGYGYDHVSVNVKGFGHCSTYIAAPNAVDGSLKPFVWYKELVVLGCIFNNFPGPYVESIGRVSSVDDPDSARSSEMRTLVERLRNGT